MRGTARDGDLRRKLRHIAEMPGDPVQYDQDCAETTIFCGLLHEELLRKLETYREFENATLQVESSLDCESNHPAPFCRVFKVRWVP